MMLWENKGGRTIECEGTFCGKHRRSLVEADYGDSQKSRERIGLPILPEMGWRDRLFQLNSFLKR